MKNIFHDEVHLSSMIEHDHIRLETQTEGSWDLRDLYSDDKAWRAELSALDAELTNCEAFRGQLSRPPMLLTYLEWDNDFTARYLRLARYVFFLQAIDDDVPRVSHLGAQHRALWARWANAADFVESEIRRVDQEILEAAYKTEPRLRDWQLYLEQMRRASPRSLSEVEESLLAQLTQPLDLTRRTTYLLVAELEIPKVIISDGTALEINIDRMNVIYRHPERAVREQARKGVFETLKKHRNTFAQTLHTSVSRLVTLARVRGFPSPLAAALEPEGLSEATFHSVIAAFERNLGVWQRCFEARKALLKLDVLKPFDLLAGFDVSLERISYLTAVEWICAALEPMGTSYVDTLRNGLTTDGWVRWSSDGRSINADMAYATYGAHPRVQVYFDGSLRAVSLLAHEMGHAMHYWHFGRAQPFHYAHTSRLVGESVANFHQAMLRSYLLSTFADAKLQSAVIEEELDFYQNYYFAKPITSKLEYAIHERVWNRLPVTPDWLNEITDQVYQQGYGSAVQPDAYTPLNWVGLGSLEDNFYNFQYLPGFAVGATLASRLQAGELMSSSIIDLLEVGTSLPLNDGLALAHINLEDPTLLERGFLELDDRATRLQGLS